MDPNEKKWDDVVPGISILSNAELDQKLEEAVIQSQTADKLICCILSEVRERGAYRDFGFSSIYDYALQRFGFKQRKTRYLLFLGRKVQELPQIREALRSGKLGWCKATRIASVASLQDETMWLDSALSLSVEELDRRIKDGTDRMTSVLHFFVTEDLRVLWENGLELARRVAGAEISPTEAFEYMVAEFVATYANGGAAPDECEPENEAEPDETAESAPVEVEVEVEEAPSDETRPLPLFPFAEEIRVDIKDDSSLVCPETERACLDGSGASFRKQILERDNWKCTYPGCNARRDFHVHHIEFRSHGGPDEAWNCTTLCAFHHKLLHAAQIRLKGRAPYQLEWTPPKLMREVIERRRNRPALWVGELEVREWPAEPELAPA
jgi:hypothetical protein